MRSILASRRSIALPVLGLSLGFALGAAIGLDFWQVVSGPLLFIVVVATWLLVEPEIRTTSADLLHPRLAFGILFVAYFSLGSTNTGTYLGIRIENWQWLLYSVGLVCFLAGSALVSFGVRPRAASAPSSNVTPRLLSKARAWRNVFFVVGIIAVGYQAGTQGMPLLGAMTSRFTLPLALGVLWPFLSRCVLAAALLACAIHFLDANAGRAQRVVNLLLLVSALGVLSLFAARAFFVPIVVVSLVLYGSYRSRLPVRSFLLIGMAVLAAMSLAAAWRTSQSGTRIYLEQQLANAGIPRDYYWIAAGYPSILSGPHVLAWTLRRVPAETDFQGGRFFFGDLLTLAPGKQLEPGYWVTSHIMHRQASVRLNNGTDIGPGPIPPSVIGGLYIDGGAPLVAVGFLLLGALLQWLYSRSLRDREPWVVVLYGLVLAFALLSLYSFLYLKTTEAFLWLLVVGALLPLRPRPHASTPAAMDRHA